MNLHRLGFVLGTLIILSVFAVVSAQVDTVQGVSGADIDGFANPALSATCTVEEGVNVLAIARTEDGNLAVYTGSEECEGLVWLSSTAVDDVDWEDADLLEELPLVEDPEVPTALTRLEDYSSVCSRAESKGRGSVDHAAPYTIFARNVNVTIPEDLRATSTDDLDLVICHETVEVVESNCPYRTSSGQSIYIQRVRRNERVWLVDYASGQITNERTISGGRPQTCPNTTRASVFYGDAVPSSEWSEWAFGIARGSNQPTIPRTIINVGNMNARAEANTQSEIVTKIPYGTPLNAIARNEAGDWIVALTPDMVQVWLFVDLLQIASETRVMDLPVAEGLAADVEIVFPTALVEDE